MDCQRIARFMKHLVAFLAFLATAIVAAPIASAQSAEKQNTVRHVTVSRGGVRTEVLEQGAGPVIVILPSLGRGAEDYDVVAAMLSVQGFRVLRPQPRGVGASAGPMTDLTLHEYAGDVAAVIDHEAKSPVVVVGHAFGNFVARMLATDRPDLVRGVVLAAASAGKVPAGVHELPIPPEVTDAINKSADTSLPDADRLRYMKLAFFAPGNDPSVWLSGWHPKALKAERVAERTPPVDVWFACGTAPILDLQAEHDAVSPRKFAGVLKSELGDRVTVVVIPNAGHALAPEQPRAMSDEIAKFAQKLYRSGEAAPNP